MQRTTAILLLFFVAITAALCLAWHRDRTTLNLIRKDLAELKERLRSADAASQNQDTSTGDIIAPETHEPEMAMVTELAHRLDELSAQQKETMALIQAVPPRMPTTEGGQVRRREESLSTLAAEVKAQEIQLEGARDRVYQIATNWNLPEELANLDSGEGLNNVMLRPFWPYFEAKREREERQRLVQILKLKLISEEVDMAVPQPAAMQP